MRDIRRKWNGCRIGSFCGQYLCLRGCAWPKVDRGTVSFKVGAWTKCKEVHYAWDQQIDQPTLPAGYLSTICGPPCIYLAHATAEIRFLLYIQKHSFDGRRQEGAAEA